MPQSDSDIITLACWAENVVGRQSHPCLIHILPAREYQIDKFRTQMCLSVKIFMKKLNK